MGRIWEKLKKDQNFVLMFVVFIAVSVTIATYLILGKPEVNKIDVAVRSSLLCALSALFFLLRSMFSRRPGKQDAVQLTLWGDKG
jgi:hypothetical protein